MSRCAPEASASIQINPLHMNVLNITCTVQGDWLYKICPEECMCKILYLTLWYFSPKWHDAVSTVWLDGGFLFQVQWCWASNEVAVRARFVNSEKQHGWLVKHYCCISIYGSLLSNSNIVLYFSTLWDIAMDFTYVSWLYWEIVNYFSAKSLFNKETKPINIDMSQDTVNC